MSSTRVFPLSVVLLLTCACSSDPAKAPGVDASANDAASNVDAAASDGGAGDGAPPDAGGESVQGVFGGTTQSFPFVYYAKVGTDGVAQIAAAPANGALPGLNLFFDPVVGTSACTVNHHDDVIETVSLTGGYQSYFSVVGSECSIVVTKFGATVGEYIDGTFTAKMVEVQNQVPTANKIDASGSFHVKRTP